ncbi:hypothetical protein Ancab_030493 [Ancistrocladus abbreviatus]
MGTEVLRPQDCLIERIRVPSAAVFPRRKSYNPKPNRTAKPAVQRKKVNNVVNNYQSEPLISKRTSYDDLKSSSKGNPVMGQVTILRRGESLDSKIKRGALKNNSNNGVDLIHLPGSEMVGPDPGRKEIRNADEKPFLSSPVPVLADVYAGSAFAVSPSPDSLPLPSFSKKKPVVSMIVDDSATRDLRRCISHEFVLLESRSSNLRSMGFGLGIVTESTTLEAKGSRYQVDTLPGKQSTDARCSLLVAFRRRRRNVQIARSYAS